MLTNTTHELINYEMRRKMRQVGVQVQDIGTYLCWQTYVDDPGRQLGVAKLVHLAKGPEVGSIAAAGSDPDADADRDRASDRHPVRAEDRGHDSRRRHGRGLRGRQGGQPRRQRRHSRRRSRTVSAASWRCATNRVTSSARTASSRTASRVRLRRQRYRHLGPRSIVEDTPGKITFGIQLEHVNFRNVSPLRVTAKVTWQPTQAAHGRGQRQEHGRRSTSSTSRPGTSTRRRSSKPRASGST